MALDLSGEVTDEQFRKVLTSLLDKFEAWRSENDWCDEFYTDYVTRLTRGWHCEYADDDDEPAMYLAPSGHMTGAERARELRDLRGRILRFTVETPDTLSAEKANEFLRAAGLAPWEPGKPGSPRAVRRHVSLRMTTDTLFTDQEITGKLRRLAESLGEAPGTLVVSCYELSLTPGIPRSETVPLLPRE